MTVWMTKTFFRAVPFALLAAFLVGGCQPAGSPVAGDPPLTGARIGGPFTLTGGDGKRHASSEFAGRYTLVYFGYSYCPDVCPVDLLHLMNGLKLFERQDPARAAKVQPLFITVDPERDTPDAVAKFAAQFHPRLLGLTGTPDEIARVAKAYLVSYRKVPGTTPDSYLMAHTQLAYLMGPDGQPVALIPTDDVRSPGNEGDPKLVAAELAKWVK